VGDGLNTEVFAEDVVCVAILNPGHFVLVDEVLPLGFVGVPADADNDEGLAGKLFGNLLHYRYRNLLEMCF